MIAQHHEIPLTTAITRSVPGRGALIQALYHECDSLYFDKPTKTNSVTKVRTTLPVKDATQVTAIITDNNSGLFVQLTGTFDTATGEKKDGPYLVFGKKYLEESKIPQLSNTGVKLWS